MSLPSFSVKDKVTIVTGASRGIGNTMARGFAEAGAKVALVARTVPQLEDTAKEIRAKGGTAIVVPTDVTRRDQVNRMVETVKKEFGRIDVLLNVAGGAGDIWVDPTETMPEEHYDDLHGRNIKAVFLCNQAVGRVMIEQKKGSIVNFSSQSGTKAIALEAVVGGFKAGVNQMSRALAVAWGPYGVRVNVIAPGITLTERVKKKLGPELIQRFSQDIPSKHAAAPEDHLGLALFLASDASFHISGAIIPSDGGPQ
ncbi:MAG: SDR family oxidoreductase [Chloroflexi bacterium]|nr:SDR family oxidoreductase [Chloroflexota bacterium]